MQSTSDNQSLSVNEAGLIIQSKLSLWAQANECYKCDIVEQVAAKGNQYNDSFFKFNTQFKWILELRNRSYDNKSDGTLAKTNDFIFAERGIYTWKNYSEYISPEVLVPPIDPYMPIYMIAVVFVISMLLWRLFQWLVRRSSSLQRIRHFLLTVDEIENDLGSPDEARELIATTSKAKTERPNRIRSLDVFRGITISFMIFVNYGGGKYWFMEHSPWNGLTIADVIFPWFAWIMGVSVAIKVKSELRNSLSRKSLVQVIAYRSLLLVFIGVILTNLRHDDLNTLRLPGVLQRLGVAYFIVGTLEATFMTPQLSSENGNSEILLDLMECWKQWIAVIFLVIIHTGVTFFMPVPNCPTGYLGPGGTSEKSKYLKCTGGAAGYLDRLIFTENHIYNRPTCRFLYHCQVPYDPEGLLGVLTTVLCIYLGVHAGRILQVFKSAGQRLKRWLMYATICILAAFLLNGFSVDEGLIPINKNLWSLSYVLMCSGQAFLIFSLLYVLVDKTRWWKGSPFYQTGMNSLVLYVGHVVCKDTFPWQWKPLVSSLHNEYVIMDLWATGLWILIAVILYKRKVFVAI